MEIILLRHGKPEVELSGYLSVKELKQMVQNYANSGIQDVPDKKIIGKFKDCYVVCSDLPRSIESAKKLGLNNINLSDQLYREIELPHFDNNFIKLPVIMWLALLRVFWLCGFKKNGESFSAARLRSRKASEELIELSQKHRKIIVIGHGLMNYLIKKELKREGWQNFKSGGKGYWKYAKFTISPVIIKN